MAAEEHESLSYPRQDPQAVLRRLAALVLLTLLVLGMSAKAATPSIATLAQPATIAAGPGEAGDEPILRLRVSPAAGASDILLRVFVNQPGADSHTPLDGAGFVGSFAFSPGADGPEEVGLPLTPNLARLLRAPDARPPMVTVVPVPLRPGSPQGEVSVAIEEAVFVGL